MWNLKNITNQPVYKTEMRVTDVENKLMVTRGERWGRDKLEIGDTHIHTTIYKTHN